MRLVCPSCGAVASAEAWPADADARQCLRIVAELPWEVSRRSLQYLALFRPQTGRGLAWSKALRLLSELAELVKTEYIQWQRQPARPGSAQAWSMAMERVIEKPPRRLPLKSHGYLRAIAYEIADELDRGNEQRKIAAERSGSARTVAEGKRVSVEEIRNFKQKLKRKAVE